MKIIVAFPGKDDILKGLYHVVGLDTHAQGIAFTMPVDDVVGIGKTEIKDKK